MQNLPTLLVLGLASFRATRFVVFDSLTDPFRERIEMWHAVKHESWIRTKIRDLFSCPYCVGFWLSLITLLVYVSAVDQWSGTSLWVHAVEVWAVAGVQALLNKWDGDM
jgi:uncharacterized protein DUF1360